MMELIVAFIVPAYVVLLGLVVREHFMPVNMDSGAKALGMVLIAAIAGIIGVVAKLGGLI